MREQQMYLKSEHTGRHYVSKLYINATDVPQKIQTTFTTLDALYKYGNRHLPVISLQLLSDAINRQ